MMRRKSSSWDQPDNVLDEQNLDVRLAEWLIVMSVRARTV
jgi:hypothetical protein